MARNVIEPACHCSGVTQRTYLVVGTQECLLSEIFSFGCIPNKVTNVPCHSGAVLFQLVYCRVGAGIDTGSAIPYYACSKFLFSDAGHKTAKRP